MLLCCDSICHGWPAWKLGPGSWTEINREGSSEFRTCFGLCLALRNKLIVISNCLTACIQDSALVDQKAHYGSVLRPSGHGGPELSTW